jgi:hypothetical protein
LALHHFQAIDLPLYLTLLHRLTQVFVQMPTIGYLDGLGRAFLDSVRITADLYSHSECHTRARTASERDTEFRQPPFKSRTVAQAGPPSPAAPAMRASSTAPDFDSASSIISQVIASSGAFARLDQQDSSDRVLAQPRESPGNIGSQMM